MLTGKDANCFESQGKRLAEEPIAQLDTKRKRDKEWGMAGMPVIGSPEDRSPKGSATAPRPDGSNTGCAWINVGAQDNAHP